MSSCFGSICGPKLSPNILGQLVPYEECIYEINTTILGENVKYQYLSGLVAGGGNRNPIPNTGPRASLGMLFGASTLITLGLQIRMITKNM
jgi:hypothetical protein